MASSSFYVGQRLTDYAGTDLLVKRVARGGFGEVAMGPDSGASDKWFALKVIRPDLLISLADVSGVAQQAQQERAARLRAGFLREALTWLGQWPHPNLLTAQFVTEINGQLMLILDYAEQGSLRDVFSDMQRRGSWLVPTSSLQLAQQIAAGLVELHTPRPDLLRDDPIVHRDLKPENILLNAYGFAMITDFGLAKAVQEATASHATTLHNSLGPTTGETILGLLASTDPATVISTAIASDALATAALPGEPVAAQRGTATQAYRTQQGVAMGTPAYMAPEQWIDAAAADCPADAYAFGVLLVELFTSEHPLLPLTRPHSLDEWRLAHLTAIPHTPADLGVGRMWQAEAQAEGQAWAQAQQEAATQVTSQLDDLCSELLAKAPAARPTLPEALARLQAMATTMGKPPYIPPGDAYPPTQPHQLAFWQGWAVAYRRFGLHQEALRRIERALALAPDNPSALSSKANILADMGQVEESVRLYRRALDRLPATDTLGRSITLNQLANRLSNAGRCAEAEEAYAEKLALQPHDAVGWYNRADNERLWARAELKEGRRAEARTHAEQGLIYAERALTLNPDDPDNVQMIRALRQLRDQL